MNKINYFQVEFKEIETKGEVIKVKGYASTPGLDRYNDIVEPKAFASSIIDYMKNPVILLQHDGNKVIGKTIDYKINFKGLEVEVEIINNLENVFENIKSGILKGFSIGYIPTKWEYITEDKTEIRKITQLDLIEISVVSIPANKESLFTLSKSIKSFFNNLQNETMKNEIKEIEVTEEIIEEVVRDEVIVDEIIEGSNLIEALDEIETSSENLEVQTETITETTENVEEVKEEVVKNESNVDEKYFTLQNEVKELKENMLELVEILAKTINEQKEVKSIIDKIPVRKGLINVPNTEKKSTLSEKLDNVRKGNFII